jgi:hypothetical protein
MMFEFAKLVENKRLLRKRLASLPIAEKLRMLDALHARSVELRHLGDGIVDGPHRETKTSSSERGSEK